MSKYDSPKAAGRALALRRNYTPLRDGAVILPFPAERAPRKTLRARVARAERHRPYKKALRAQIQGA